MPRSTYRFSLFHSTGDPLPSPAYASHLSLMDNRGRSERACVCVCDFFVKFVWVVATKMMAVSLWLHRELGGAAVASTKIHDAEFTYIRTDSHIQLEYWCGTIMPHTRMNRMKYTHIRTNEESVSHPYESSWGARCKNKGAKTIVVCLWW